MDGPNFDPVMGEEVRVHNRPGLFKIIRVQPFVWTARPELENLSVREMGLDTVDLKQDGSNSLLHGVPWFLLEFDEVRSVRRAIEWLKTNPDGKKFPDYIVDYEVNARDDHAGNPSIFVRFLVNQDYLYGEDGHPSHENIAALNEFTFKVQQVLLGLELDRWTYVQTGEARRELDVAS